jgi:hypothetical protein
LASKLARNLRLLTSAATRDGKSDHPCLLSHSCLEKRSRPCQHGCQHRLDKDRIYRWLTMRRWLEANPDDEFAKDLRAKLDAGAMLAGTHKEDATRLRIPASTTMES